MKLNRNYLYELFMETVKTTYEKADDLIEDISKALCVDNEKVANWLNGTETVIDPIYVKRLEYFFGCEYKYLIDDRTAGKSKNNAEEKRPFSREEQESIKKLYLSIVGYIREIEQVLQKKYTMNEIQKAIAMKKSYQTDGNKYLYSLKNVKNVFETSYEKSRIK